MSGEFELYWQGQKHEDLDHACGWPTGCLYSVFLYLSDEVEKKYDIRSEFSLFNDDPLKHVPNSDHCLWALPEDVADAAERLLEGVRKRDPLLLEAASVYAPDPRGGIFEVSERLRLEAIENVEEQHWGEFEQDLLRFIEDVRWASDNGARLITFDILSMESAVDRANPDTALDTVTSAQQPLRSRLIDWWTDLFGK